VERVVVTGATGFIGQHLCSALHNKGVKLHVLGRREPDIDAKFHFWNLQTPLDDTFPKDVDVIFHLAGKAHVLSNDYHDDEEYFQINLAATRKLLQAAKAAGVRRFVYFSSVKAMGEDSDLCLDETCTLLPKGMYGRSKLMAEELVLHGDYVAEPVVIRPTMVYGNSERGNLSKMIRGIRAGKFPPLSETSNRRSMVHVDDLVQAAILAAEDVKAVGKIYIVTDGQSYSTRRMYEWICEALHKPLPGWHLPCWVLKLLAISGDIIGSLSGRRFVFDSDALEKLTGSAFYSSASIESELGFKANRSLKESLPDIVQYLGGSR